MQSESTGVRNETSLQHVHVFVAGVCALVLTLGIARFAYTPMLPIMATKAGLSPLAGGWLASANYAGYMAGTILASSIGDLGKKYSLYRFGLVTAVASTAAMGLTEDVVTWAVLRFIAGLSSIAGMLLASGLILNWLIRTGKKPELGLHFTGIGLGVVVSGLAVQVTADAMTWDEQWLFLGLMGALLLIPAWRWLPRPSNSTQIVEILEAAHRSPSRLWLVWAALSYFCAGFGFAIGATFIVAILETLPILSGHGGWVWVGVGFAAIPSGFIWDRLAKRWGATRALQLAYLLHAFAFAFPVMSANAAGNLLGAVLFGGTFAGIVSLTLSVVGRQFPANPGKAMARMTLSYGTAQIIAPAAAGYVAATTGSYMNALVVTVLVVFTGLLLLYVSEREEVR